MSGVLFACRSGSPCHRVVPGFPANLEDRYMMLRTMFQRQQERFQLGDLENARWAAETMVSACQSHRHPGLTLYARVLLGDVVRAQGQLEMAETIYKAVEIAATADYPYREYAQMARFGLGLIAFQRNHPDVLARLVETHGATAADGCHCALIYRHEFLTGLYNILAGELTLATKGFEHLRQSCYRVYDQLVADMAMAEIIARRGEPRSAADALARLSGMMDRGMLRGAFVNHVWLFPNAALIARQYNLCGANKALGLTLTSVPTAHLPSVQPDIQVGLFGPGRLCRAKEDVAVHQPIDRALLAYLALHPDGADRRDVCRDLMPEVEDDDVVLETMLRFRNHLPAKTVALRDGVYQFVGSVLCDAVEFDHLHERSRTLEFGDRYDTLQRAVALYRAPFLQGISGYVWVDELRTQYERRVGWMHYQLAALYFADEQYQESLSHLERALLQNPFFDAAVEDLMRVLFFMDQPIQALHVFDVYAERVNATFGCPPPRTLRELRVKVAQDLAAVGAPAPVTGAFSEGRMRRQGIVRTHSRPRLRAEEELMLPWQTA